MPSIHKSKAFFGYTNPVYKELEKFINENKIVVTYIHSDMAASPGYNPEGCVILIYRALD